MLPTHRSAAFSPDPAAIEFRFVRASGPGGQNVNKVSTAVELRYDTRLDPGLAPDVRERLLRLAGSRATGDGVIVIHAQRLRSQPQNRADALARLGVLLARALHRPRTRIATAPSAAQRRRRLADKKARAQTKQGRAGVRSDGD